MKSRFICLGAAFFIGEGGAASAPERPNLVVILADDVGYDDIGCFWTPDDRPGYEKIETPRLDRMAAEGIRFTDFYAAASVCTPTRAALMTGCYPPRVGLGAPGDPDPLNVRGLVLGTQSEIGIHPDETTLAELLKKAGYATACVGKWHLGYQPPFLPVSQGFDLFYGLPFGHDYKAAALMRGARVIETTYLQETLMDRFTQEAVSFIKERRDKPFFLYLACTDAHVPIYVEERFLGKSKRGPFGDAVMRIDACVGSVLDSLTSEGIDEKTLVIFVSDNGPWLVKEREGGKASPLRAGKGTTYEGGMRVPFIARWPGKIPPGRLSSEVASVIDILPTVAGLAGAPIPARPIDGKEIWPLLSGVPGATSPHEAFFYYYKNDLQAVRSGRWKLVYPRLKMQENLYVYTRLNELPPEAHEKVPEALYDLATDIGEKNNVIQDHPEEATRLRALADRMRKELGGLKGDGPGCRPPGTSSGQRR